MKTHDFPDKDLGKAVPYGVYDIGSNEAGVTVGIGHDTAEFAVAAIKRWWQKMGRKRYRSPRRILITADCGGSNSPSANGSNVHFEEPVPSGVIAATAL